MFCTGIVAGVQRYNDDTTMLRCTPVHLVMLAPKNRAEKYKFVLFVVAFKEIVRQQLWQLASISIPPDLEDETGGEDSQARVVRPVPVSRCVVPSKFCKVGDAPNRKLNDITEIKFNS